MQVLYLANYLLCFPRLSGKLIYFQQRLFKKEKKEGEERQDAEKKGTLIQRKRNNEDTEKENRGQI